MTREEMLCIHIDRDHERSVWNSVMHGSLESYHAFLHLHGIKLNHTHTAEARYLPAWRSASDP